MSTKEFAEQILGMIGSYAECFDCSRTEENVEFVQGVIYGLNLAAESIKGQIKHLDRKENDGSTESEKKQE